jgi:hypothetical protein
MNQHGVEMTPPVYDYKSDFPKPGSNGYTLEGVSAVQYRSLGRFDDRVQFLDIFDYEHECKVC